jgi:dienelactone hydrolase
MRPSAGVLLAFLLLSGPVACGTPAPELVPLNLIARDLVDESPGERLFGLLFHDPDGRELNAYLREPFNIETGEAEGPHPAILLAAGRYAGREAAAVIPGPLTQIVLAVEYPADIPERMGVGAWIQGLPAFVRAAHRMPGLLRGAGHYMAALPEVDANRLTLVGVSFGVPFAASAGRDRVFTGVALHFGGADIAGMLRANLPINNAMIRSGFAEFGAWVFRDLEPAKNVGGISPTPLLLINGSEDKQIPRSSALLLAERATPPVRHIWLQYGHLSSRDHQLLRELADSTFHHFDFGRIQAVETIQDSGSS